VLGDVLPSVFEKNTGEDELAVVYAGGVFELCNREAKGRCASCSWFCCPR